MHPAMNLLDSCISKVKLKYHFQENQAKSLLKTIIILRNAVNM
jgi:hypothetical protein